VRGIKSRGASTDKLNLLQGKAVNVAVDGVPAVIACPGRKPARHRHPEGGIDGAEHGPAGVQPRENRQVRAQGWRRQGPMGRIAPVAASRPSVRRRSPGGAISADHDLNEARR